MCLAQGHNTVRPVRLEPSAPRSPVKHSTTEPLILVQLGSLHAYLTLSPLAETLLSADNLYKQFWTQIRPDILLGLILVQTVWHSEVYIAEISLKQSKTAFKITQHAESLRQT